MSSRLVALVLAPKPVLAGIALAFTSLGAAIGLDTGGIGAALIGAIVAAATSLISYGVLRGRLQSQIAEHERRLNENDSAHDDMSVKLDAHRTEFSQFARAMERDVGVLVGEARSRRRRGRSQESES